MTSIFKIPLSFFNNSLRVYNISQTNNYNLNIDIHDWMINKKKSSHDNSLIIFTNLHLVSWCAKGSETPIIRQINFTLTLSRSNTSPVTGLTEILLVIKTASIGAVNRNQSRASTDVVNCDLTGDRLSVEVVPTSFKFKSDRWAHAYLPSFLLGCRTLNNSNLAVLISNFFFFFFSNDFINKFLDTSKYVH